MGGKTWYNIEIDITQIGYIEYNEHIVKTTLDELDDYINNLNIDVLLGFSQGANVIDTYLVNRKNSIKCAILFSGYSFVDSCRQLPNTPVMNVISDSDIIVQSKYAPFYTNMTIKKHDKGHKLPTSRPFIREIIEYIHSNCISL